MKQFLAIFFLTINFVVKNDCYSQSNIVILIDSRIYYNNDEVYENFSNTKKQLCNNLGSQLSSFSDPSNLYSLYIYTNDFDEVIQATNIQALKSWDNLSLNDGRKTEDLQERKAYFNAYELLKQINDQLSEKVDDIFFKSTLFIVVGQLGEQFFISGNPSQILQFTKANEAASIHYNYYVKYPAEPTYDTYTPEEEEPEILERDTIMPIRTYQLTRSIKSITSQGDDKEALIKSDRKTMPGKEALQIFPIDGDSTIKLNIPGKSKIKILSCVLSNITGNNNKEQLLSQDQSIIFSPGNNNLPGELKEMVDADVKFPLFNMLQPYLQLTAANTFDPVYTGSMAVNYLVIDDIYSHAVFSDIISFKITLPEPESMYVGFQNHEILDNANLIKYGNKKFPNEGVTQEKIAEWKIWQLKTGKTIAIVVAILIVAVYWFLIRKNKRFSWQALRGRL